MMYYKNVATPCFTVKDVKTRLGPAKFLESSKALYKWMNEMIEQYDSVVQEGRADTSFASEAVAEATTEAIGEVEDPTANTKMITWKK